MAISKKLKLLKDDWEDECEHFLRAEKRWLASVSAFTSINSQIYKQCIKESIEIFSLNLKTR